MHFLRALWLVITALIPKEALAHNPLAWESREPAVIFAALLLAFVWLAYWAGCRRRSPSLSRRWLFHGTTFLAALVLFGPLDEWAETNAAAHMVQHMGIMVVIAPLWVLARPLPQWSALHAQLVQGLFAPLLRCVRYPMLAASVHGAVVWFWHAPRLYVLALDHPWWHVFEHFCFLLSAGLFWWAVLRSQQRRAPVALLALLFTLMHTGFLGALLTFSPASLYGESRSLADQQLAGLLMWVLGGLPYLSAALWIAWRWFQRVLRPSVANVGR